MGDAFLLRLFTEGSWFENERGYFYTAGISLFQPIDHRRSLEYRIANSFRTEPNNYLDETVLLVRYRQEIWGKWVYAEINPQVSWRRERDYDGKPGILLRLETIFGGR